MRVAKVLKYANAMRIWLLLTNGRSSGGPLLRSFTVSDKGYIMGVLARRGGHSEDGMTDKSVDLLDPRASFSLAGTLKIFPPLYT